VVVGAGAKVLGAIFIGPGSRIGANAVVIRDVPPESVVVGVPGQIIRRSKPHIPAGSPDLDHTQMPDTLGTAIGSLMERVNELEMRMLGHESELPHPHAQKNGTWKGEDFQI
jgi:serine O-acetyltransferase